MSRAYLLEMQGSLGKQEASPITDLQRRSGRWKQAGWCL